MTFISTWFQQGFMHPFLTPSHIIILVSLGILIAQQGVKISYWLAFTFFAFIGVLLKQNVEFDANNELILLALALLVSLLIVLKFRLPPTLVLLLTIISAVVVAYDSDPIVIPGVGTNSINNWLLGAVVSMVGFVVLLSIIATFLRRFWEGIILRILGSWIATSAIFIITLTFVSPLTKGLS